MALQNSHRSITATTQWFAAVCNPVHGAGICPNAMNRFVHSNTHRVLFVT
jgi:hypothetical protein